jgi:hypothetical protein
LYGTGPRAGSPPPITLESSPLDGLDPLQGPKPSTRSSSAPSPPIPAPPPPRRFRLFGWFQPAPTPSSSRLRAGDAPIKVEPRDDPAADAALKRRLEAQIRDATGNHLRSLDVRVVDRTVTIHARPDHFWRRRAVRRSIDSLPGLSGYKTTIEVDE